MEEICVRDVTYIHRSVAILLFSVVHRNLLIDLSNPQGRNDSISELMLVKSLPKKSNHDYTFGTTVFLSLVLSRG